MGRGMSRESRLELIAALGKRYRAAGRAEKARILDEFTSVTGYHRKHAIRVLNQVMTRTRPTGTRAKVYDEAVQEALVVIWEAADRICGKRLRAAMPGLVASMEQFGHLGLDGDVRDKLLRMSAATIDRRLTQVRQGASGRPKRSPKNHAIKRQIPVRTFADWGDARPGYLEADFVVHAGGSLRGSPVHSFVLTDVCSGWTEAVPLLAREQSLVIEALRVIQRQIPFRILGIDTDNDGAFINDSVLTYCRDAGIEQTRSRAYRKNDQAWIEQKNGAVVRRLVGYDRFEGAAATRILARLYGVARLYVNFFQPSFKLLSKSRDGSKVKKLYRAPATPCDRLLGDPRVEAEVKERLVQERADLDPVRLLHTLRECQEALAALAGRSVPDDVQKADVEEFMRALPLLWKQGEVRPTHRAKQKPARAYRTRLDPFETVWPEARRWLMKHPEGTGRQLFDYLNDENPGAFTSGQLRTLQRRVRDWRSQMARSLILPGDVNGAVDEWLTGEAAE